MDAEDRDALLILGTILVLVIVLPLLILEAPWVLALAMVLVAGYWWETRRNPVSVILEAVRDDQAADSRDRLDPATDDPLTVLRERYARGEISDEEFERRLDRLLETETESLSRERSRIYER
ncbi:SHOCT domain-containing protein [Halalkalicoccus jeotgali]|uniref:SHOCT domain-containing protein n=1 Tax=Halalkalicoccus jeotgali (strain DSM 18796 / CECT 7217 / JCM 14584 / KCTC 4019 / B3) TaxID=795797 RepID=D8JAT2_HALJB|nr:SHOCT domain-containing protein [Halalkalicoccus jeotgali]ADJ14804.1 hypothetical protein HacjB3_07085 [Halalkalicoccus jeotgali B3]ELY39386.1 hypothetical protein C497_05492 [Halalkalicoccus jeotgali B3]